MVEIHDLHVRFHGASREAVAGIDPDPSATARSSGSWARAAAARP